jgi:hypothetical protein
MVIGTLIHISKALDKFLLNKFRHNKILLYCSDISNIVNLKKISIKLKAQSADPVLLSCHFVLRTVVYGYVILHEINVQLISVMLTVMQW